MTIHEFGPKQGRVIVLIHPSVVMWDYFEYVIPLLEGRYRLIVPALPGYDEAQPEQDFTSVEQIAGDLACWLEGQGIPEVDLLYGCSMGGSIVLRMLADGKLPVKAAVCDGGITPYQLLWIVTRLIALRDFLMIAMGKAGGLGLLEKAFSTDEYSREDLQYVAKVLKFISCKTIWRTFESCNNYAMPKPVPPCSGILQYWYGEKERKDRSWDIRYVRETFPKTEFIELKGLGHASMASLHPQEMAERFEALLENPR